MTIVNEELAYKILDLLAKNDGRMDYVAILNALVPASGTDSHETLTAMIALNLIKGKTKANEYLEITTKGKTELQVHCKRLLDKAENAAKDIADKRSERRAQIINTIIGSAIGGLIGTGLGSLLAFLFDLIFK